MEPHIIEEREIPKCYLFKTPPEIKPMAYLDRFEVRSGARDFSLLENLKDEDRICEDDSEMVGIECQDDMLLYFTGFLVLPSDASKFLDPSRDSDILEKPENRTFYLMCSPSRMWSFDYSEDLRGIWFENENGWYKLLNPSKKYHPIFEPFKKKCDLWFAIYDILKNNFSASFEQVIDLLKGKYSEKYILDNAQFVITNCTNATMEKLNRKFSSSAFAVEMRRRNIERLLADEKKQLKVVNESTVDKKRERIETETPAKKQKIKKSKQKSLINPILLDSFNELKEVWKEEANNGELSDSGDRNIIRHALTCCNFCQKHRHSFIACARCEEYQLCSVCFINLKMHEQVKSKYLKNGKTAFEYCGENSLFTCRPCFEEQESDSTSQDSFILDE